MPVQEVVVDLELDEGVTFIKDFEFAYQETEGGPELPFSLEGREVQIYILDLFPRSVRLTTAGETSDLGSSVVVLGARAEGKVRWKLTDEDMSALARQTEQAHYKVYITGGGDTDLYVKGSINLERR